MLIKIKEDTWINTEKIEAISILETYRMPTKYFVNFSGIGNNGGIESDRFDTYEEAEEFVSKVVILANEGLQ